MTESAALLPELLREHYGLDAVRIRPGQRGWMAETFIVETADDRWFAKLIPKSRYTGNIELALPIQRELRASGLDQMPGPLATRTGRLSVPLEDDTLVVYDYIDGAWTTDYPLDDLVELLAHLHATDVRSPAERETFEQWVFPEFQETVGRLLDGTFDDPSVVALQAAIRDRWGELEARVARYEALVSKLGGLRDVPMVMTHHDAPGNILKATDGRIYLIDWDDVIWAPRERDTWWHLYAPDDAARFLPLYRRAFPDYEPDWRFVEFYLYGFYFEVIEGLAARAISPDSSAAVRAETLGSFRGDMAWLEPAVRRIPG